MANKDCIFGARVAGHLQTSAANARIRTYVVPAADGTALYVGDFVKLAGEAYQGEDGEYYPGVIQAAATETLVGVVVGFAPNSSYQNQIYRTASTLRRVYVCDDPYAIFEIQYSDTLAAADIGLNADITVAAGSTVTGLSGMEADTVTGAGATAQLRVMDIVRRADNEIGAHAKILVCINEHQYKTTTGA